VTDWKRPLFVGIGWGLGTAVGLVILVGGFLWYESRPKPPKPWNTRAIEAHYSNTQFFAEKGSTLQAGFVFDLRNNTAADYTLEAHPSDTTVVMQKMKSSDTLVSGMGLTWSPEHGPGTQQLDEQGIPSKIPKGAFIDAPIFIPSGQSVRIYFWSAYDVPDIVAAFPKNETIHPKTVLQSALKDTESFVLLDTVNRYRIELPLQDAVK
jgi:hypothetical protein